MSHDCIPTACAECAPDLALLPSLRLPEGWSTRSNPIGRLGADIILYDADGDWVGCYGYVSGHREDGPAGMWMCGGVRMRSQQACVDALVGRAS